VPSWLLYLIGVLIFAFGLLLSIALHEIGHMVPAKKFGVKVTQYMVGFGPTVWSRKRGDTEYGLKAVPLGGYIRMIGMVPPRADGTRSRWPRRMATAIEDFRQVSRAEVEPQDAEREFYRLTPGKKMIIMLGGPCMNLAIYLVLTLIVLLTMGMPHYDLTTRISSVTKCVVPATSKDANSTTCPTHARRAPAFGKLHPGDRIVAVDGTAVAGWNQLVHIIQRSAGVPLQLTVQRHGTTRMLSVTPVKNLKWANAAETRTIEAGFLGVTASEHRYYAALPITQVPGQIGSQIRQGVDALGRFPSKISSLWGTVFEGKKRDINGPVGVVGIGRISGDFAASHQLTVKDKIYTLLGLLASVNLLLFFFNLLPLLPLDGGHVAGAVVEAVRRGWARLRARRPAAAAADHPAQRPQIFVDTAQMLPVMYAVASVLVLLTLLTLWADIVKPINPIGG
jgi:membrane-associated protease RseP (regulator of RpoE activity)